MLLSLKWLRDFVPYEGTAEELGARLTMLGLELEEIRRPFEEIKDIVIGRVVECGKHPEADKLSVCKVDINMGELLDIVCGAPNVAKGQLVPVAPVGATLPGGLTIKKAKLRGSPSHGMICSERELALSEDHGGIMVLPENFTPGQNFIEAFELDREVLDISVTPNRSDCLSVLGLAREVALAFNLPLTLPPFEALPAEGDATDLVKIEIADPELCWLYQGRIIDGIAIKPSPLALRCRLLASGMRPISGIVDATNYIMLGYGQPLHAFDLDKVEGGRIIISPAVQGEKLITLDGQDRALVPDDLLIRDAVKPVALAGVMGGLNSEITASTKRVFLESAVFRPASIRRTARRLGLPSEASARFERGVDPRANAMAMDRAARLMVELAGGTVLGGICCNEAKPFKPSRVSFSVQNAVDLLGVELTGDFCRNVLEKVGCLAGAPCICPSGKPCVCGGESSEIVYECPSWRPDLTREADLIEEVGRVYGVDRIPPVLPVVLRPIDEPENENRFAFQSLLKKWGRGLGLNEAINYSFLGGKDLDFLGLAPEGRVMIMNPLSAEQDVLRTRLFPGLLQNLGHNLAQGNGSLRLFEIARIFSSDPASETTVTERERLGLLLYGACFDAHWPQTQRDADYCDIKGMVENLLSSLHLPVPSYVLSREYSCLNPEVKLTIKWRGEDRNLGFIGRLMPETAENFHARKDVWLAEIDLDLLRNMSKDVRVAFAPLPVYPPVRRDITAIAAPGITVEALLAHILGMRLQFLESACLVDNFEPKDSAVRHLTFRLTFRHAKRTLKDAEVDKEREKAAESLVKNLGVKI